MRSASIACATTDADATVPPLSSLQSKDAATWRTIGSGSTQKAAQVVPDADAAATVEPMRSRHNPSGATVNRGMSRPSSGPFGTVVPRPWMGPGRVIGGTGLRTRVPAAFLATGSATSKRAGVSVGAAPGSVSPAAARVGPGSAARACAKPGSSIRRVASWSRCWAMERRAAMASGEAPKAASSASEGRSPPKETVSPSRTGRRDSASVMPGKVGMVAGSEPGTGSGGAMPSAFSSDRAYTRGCMPNRWADAGAPPRVRRRRAGPYVLVTDVLWVAES